MMNISGKCQQKRIILVFHLISLNTRVFSLVISKNSTQKLRHKFTAIEFFLTLKGSVATSVALLEPLEHVFACAFSFNNKDFA